MLVTSGPFCFNSERGGKILHAWGSRLTWAARRADAAQIVGGMESFLAGDGFLTSLVGGRGDDEGGGDE